MNIIIYSLLKIVLVCLISPLCIGIVRKVKAYMQGRKGASIIQPYFDLWKLFHKDEVIPNTSSWIFLITPYLLFAVSILLIAGVPLLGYFEPLYALSDFVVMIYLLAIMAFFIALAGIDSGSAFGGFGSSREMTLAALTEGTLLFSLLPASIITHSGNLLFIAQSVATLPLELYFPLVIAFIGFFIALLSETGRIPFDNPATHLELTMIHEAMILEYSGKRLALIEWANANKFIFFILLGVNIFFPWGIALTMDPVSLLIAAATVVLKAFVLIVVVAFFESSTAKLRYFKLPDLLFTGFVFSVISLIVMSL